MENCLRMESQFSLVYTQNVLLKDIHAHFLGNSIRRLLFLVFFLLRNILIVQLNGRNLKIILIEL